jgi:hypothetical protein
MIEIYFEHHFKLQNIPEKIEKALDQLAQRRAYHPICDYLDGLKPADDMTADEVELPLIKYLGAPDTPYVREITRKFLLAAAHRVHSPGCAFPTMLVLSGAQGIGKSLFCEFLARKREWYSEELTFSQMEKTRDAVESFGESWICEIPELQGMRKADVANVKRFLSAKEDIFRRVYEKSVTVKPREQVFIGTDNEAEFLSDATGARRFWVVSCGGNCLDVLRADKSQRNHAAIDRLWGATMKLYRELLAEFGEDGLENYLCHLDNAKDAEAAQKAATIQLPYADQVETFCAAHSDEDLTILRIWSEGIGGGGIVELEKDPRVRRAIGQTLRKLGWTAYAQRKVCQYRHGGENGEIKNVVISSWWRPPEKASEMPEPDSAADTDAADEAEQQYRREMIDWIDRQWRKGGENERKISEYAVLCGKSASDWQLLNDEQLRHLTDIL